MNGQRVVVLSQGLIGTCAVVALVLLGAFYSTVSGSVERAARHRIAAAENTPRAATMPTQRPTPRGPPLLARVDN